MGDRTFSDEQLMAFVDGELDEALSAEIEQALNSDPTLQARLEPFILTRELAGKAFDETLQQPVPVELSNAVYADRPRGTVHTLNNSEPPSRPPWQLGQMSIAASLALVVGTLIGSTFSISSGQPASLTNSGYINSSNPLYQALEQTPQHQPYPMGEESHQMTPLLSFQAKDGRLCREFEIQADASISIAIACKETQQWRIEVLLAATAPQLSNGYRPASGHGEDAMGKVLDQLWAVQIDAQQEQHYLSSGW